MSNPRVGDRLGTAALHAVMEGQPARVDRILGNMLDDELEEFQSQVALLSGAIMSARYERKARRSGSRGSRT